MLYNQQVQVKQWGGKNTYFTYFVQTNKKYFW